MAAHAVGLFIIKWPGLHDEIDEQVENLKLLFFLGQVLRNT